MPPPASWACCAARRVGSPGSPGIGSTSLPPRGRGGRASPPRTPLHGRLELPDRRDVGELVEHDAHRRHDVVDVAATMLPRRRRRRWPRRGGRAPARRSRWPRSASRTPGRRRCPGSSACAAGSRRRSRSRSFGCMSWKVLSPPRWFGLIWFLVRVSVPAPVKWHVPHDCTPSLPTCMSQNSALPSAAATFAIADVVVLVGRGHVVGVGVDQVVGSVGPCRPPRARAATACAARPRR